MNLEKEAASTSYATLLALIFLFTSQYVKTEVYTGVLATKWHYEYWAFGLLNSQNVWVTKSKPHRPIRYEMKGYDSMLGSYYDHYVLEYVSFEQWRPQMKRFELPRGTNAFCCIEFNAVPARLSYDKQG